VLVLLAGPTAERFKNGGAPFFGSRNATYEVRVHAWKSSKPLRENKPHPMGGPLAMGSRSSPSNVGLFAPSFPVPEGAANRPTIDQSRITTFVDRLSPSHMDLIKG
jgi:hypothetical protein